MKNVPLNALERRSLAALSSVLGLRMLGLFLILPVFALYADRLEGANAMLVGIALGAYGVTQALLQVPFGILSDRFGRKPLLTAGLLLFALGSVVAAQATTIESVIFGRALQGAGAISAVALALLADLTREEQRTKAMALAGMSIGASFLAALILGPLLAESVGLQGLFWVSGFLAVAALPVVWWLIPAARVLANGSDQQPVRGQLQAVLLDPQLVRLDVGIFVLHMVLTALFVAVPFALRDSVGLSPGRHWQIYIPVLLLSVLAMVPLLLLSMKRRNTMRVFRVAIGILLGALLVLAVGSDEVVLLIGGLWLFFTGFNLLEAMLPSLTSRLAPATRKGSALGIYNTFQFTGVFFGGVLGGLTYSMWGAEGVFIFAAVSVVLWLVLALTGPAPALPESLTVRLERADPGDLAGLGDRLRQVTGVQEITVMPERGVAYLKVDPQIIDRETLKRLDGIIAVE
ncbi:MAG: MFS transporter [Arenicellales bacterium]|nr:MFS transporter [Arenicellales bacterium]